MARKRAAGKDKAFEDEYLMKSWKGSVEKINNLLSTTLFNPGDVHDLIMALLTQNYLLLAGRVQKAFNQLVTVVKQNIHEVFRIQPTPIILPFHDELPEEDRPKPSIIEPPTLSQEKWWSDVLEH
jgi:chemotaxis regulatin CheY-phosphate phosphatase CheZ